MRYLPDVSLFAANGLWSHIYVYCMSDTSEGGTACSNAHSSGGGGTSYVAPILAGVQALLNEAVGAPQGNPAPIYYQLAAAEYGLTGSATCNSGTPKTPKTYLPDSGCVFHDVTTGDNDVPCSGPLNCFGDVSSGGLPDAGYYGALATSTSVFSPAYAAAAGWDYTTGLGTLDVSNLIKAWSAAVE